MPEWITDELYLWTKERLHRQQLPPMNNIRGFGEK